MKRTIIIAFALLFPFMGLISCGTVPEAAQPKQEQPQPEPEQKAENQQADEEYKRSVGEIGEVSKEEFLHDKTEIINIINELQKIMDRQDYQAWLSYISRSSIQYYSSPVNIRKVNKRLPDKTISLRGLEDYFKYIFIPSRKQSKVDEIRYISKSEVKAVQVLPNGSTIVYYNFIREDGEWKVNIPTL